MAAETFVTATASAETEATPGMATETALAETAPTTGTAIGISAAKATRETS